MSNDHRLRHDCAGRPPNRTRTGWITVTAVLWIGTIVCGLAWAVHSDATPGSPACAPPTWPGESSLKPGSDRPTVLMFAHPRCPCTRASLDELRELLSGSHAEARVVFTVPERTTPDWMDTGLWNAARAIPGVCPEGDPGGRQASRFGCVTSGQVLIYDARRTLVFSGGITAARGTRGGNEGRRAARDALRGRRCASAFPVFGCPLVLPGLPANAACPLCDAEAP